MLKQKMTLDLGEGDDVLKDEVEDLQKYTYLIEN